MSDKKNKKLILKKSKKRLREESDSDSDFSDTTSDYSSDSDNNVKQNQKKFFSTAKRPKKIFDDNSDDSSDDNSVGSDQLVKLKNKNTNDKLIKNSNEIFKELIKKQLPDIPSQWKLNINDMKRICKYINTSIFDEDDCCIWNGYITNMNNSNKGTYVNFYFRNKKVALHRLLYSNFVAPLDSSEYLKFNCEHKGICCNINHYEKYKYSKNTIMPTNNATKREPKHREPKKEIHEIQIIGPDDPEKLIIDFD